MGVWVLSTILLVEYQYGVMSVTGDIISGPVLDMPVYDKSFSRPPPYKLIMTDVQSTIRKPATTPGEGSVRRTKSPFAYAFLVASCNA
jgi:hypothetical protein